MAIKKQTESGLEKSAPIESAPIANKAASIGTPVVFKAIKGSPGLIDKKKVLIDNFDSLRLEMEALKAQREEEGYHSLNSPVVFYAMVAKSVNDPSVKGGYAVRVGMLRAHAGQGHVTAIKRLLDLGHMIIGHDLPTVSAFKEMKERVGARDLEDSIQRLSDLVSFVEDQIDITFNRQGAEVAIGENSALKQKIKELEARITEAK